jgi:hypothetical protein
MGPLLLGLDGLALRVAGAAEAWLTLLGGLVGEGLDTRSFSEMSYRPSRPWVYWLTLLTALL